MSTIGDLPPSAEILTGNQAGFRFVGDASGRASRLSFKVRWEEMARFLEVLGGLPVTVRGVTRRVPLAHPFLPNLYAVAVSDGKGMGADDKISPTRLHPWVVFDVEFGQLPFGVDGDAAFISLSHGGAGRSVTVPGRQYTFSNGSKILQDVGVPVGGVGIRATIHQLPSLTSFVSAVLALENKVNSLPLTIAGVTYDAGTVFLDSFETSTNRSLFGIEQSEATISLIQSALPWNQAIRADGVVDDVTPAPFVTADLNALIM